MKKLFLILSVAAAFTSCKKDSTVTPPPSVTKNLVKATYVFDMDPPKIDEYTYDGQRRITVHKQDTRTSTFNYVSAISLVVTVRNNTDNSLYRTNECTLNDNGYITKLIIKDAAGALIFTYDYTYNADGYITKVKGTYPSGNILEFDYTIVNGNVVSARNYTGGVLSYSGEYTYDNSKINKTPGGHAGSWQSHYLFGKRLKNLIVEYKSFNPAGTLTWHTQTSYVMDADGYPVKETTFYVLQGKQAVDTFIYQ